MYELTAEQDDRIDWGKTAADYAKHRPGPPPSFYRRLQALGIGLPEQYVLDLATGTGVIARQLAKQGCHVMASDIATGQVEMAKALAKEQGLSIEFQTASAEDTQAPPQSLDAVTANQCFLYFDTQTVVENLIRWLKPAGSLVISHFSWLPDVDPIAKASENLILQHNPNWQGADYHGATQPKYPGLLPSMHYCGYFYYDEAIPFTRESWMGRIRASRGIGATLNAKQVAAFDAEHEALLTQIAEPEFTITHRIDAHILRPGTVTTG
jgi:SAM-dependent methyltransferase